MIRGLNFSFLICNIVANRIYLPLIIQNTMLKNLLVTFSILVFGTVLAQSTAPDTLRNLGAEVNLEAHIMTGTTQGGTPEWGSYLGHNTYGDEGFAERYDVTGQVEVVGVVVHLGGHSANTTRNANFRIYPVSGSGLPGSPIQTVSVPISQLNLTGEPHIVMFSSSIAVSNSFFVGMEFNDYSHHGTGGDTVYLLAGPHGSRDGADLAQAGRNAVRWHSHGPTANWKDFYTENFSPIATHLALFPIVNTAALSLTQQANQTGTFLYPNPATPGSTIHITGPTEDVSALRMLDINGRTVFEVNDYTSLQNKSFVLPLSLPIGLYTVEVNKVGSPPAYQMFSVR